MIDKNVIVYLGFGNERMGIGFGFLWGKIIKIFRILFIFIFIYIVYSDLKNLGYGVST
jgi:hypothetical protein